MYSSHNDDEDVTFSEFDSKDWYPISLLLLSVDDIASALVVTIESIPLPLIPQEVDRSETGSVFTVVSDGPTLAILLPVLLPFVVGTADVVDG